MRSCYATHCYDSVAGDIEKYDQSESHHSSSVDSE